MPNFQLGRQRGRFNFKPSDHKTFSQRYISYHGRPLNKTIPCSISMFGDYVILEPRVMLEAGPTHSTEIETRFNSRTPTPLEALMKVK